MDNKKLKSSWAAAFTVASVWFGTHVGAGFATGNQVVNYFVQYGWTAAIFPLLAMGILAVVMYIMMKFAKLSGFDNYKDTYRALYPKPWMEVFFEVFYIIIILAAVASCVDGAGGIVKSLIDLPDIICNLVIIALLILLSIFGVDLIIKASTVLSTAILIVTAILVIMGFVVPIDAVAQELATENAAYASIPAIADVTSQKGLEGVWRGVFVYAAFQCVSVPAMIAASTELTHKGVKRASILGWLMNGGALAASGAMLLRWYPILCAIKSRDAQGRFVLTIRELLGTWAENAAAFTVGETVVGIVRSVEEYGTFIEIAPNLAGLAESCPDLRPGQAVSVYIKNILPEKMKIKLVIVNHALSQSHRFELRYFITEGHLDHWLYSTPESHKRIETDFSVMACNPA